MFIVTATKITMATATVSNVTTITSSSVFLMLLFSNCRSRNAFKARRLLAAAASHVK